MPLKLPLTVIMVDYRGNRMPFRLTPCRVKAYDADDGRAADLEPITDPDHAAIVATLEPADMRAHAYALAYVFDHTEEVNHGTGREDKGPATGGP